MMTTQEAEEKYLHRMVVHHTKPFLFIISNIVRVESIYSDSFMVHFRHPHYEQMPEEHPVCASLEELERDWKVLG